MRPVLYKMLLVSLVLSGSFSAAVAAQKLLFNSGPAKTQLIELYTSQGCSSCPPAEKLLSDLVASKRLWRDFIPIAFHVDYWDYLGWQDIYADSSFTDRQRKHFQLGNISNVYTPGFVVDGKEWRGFFRGRDIPPNNADLAGNLTLKWDSESQIATVNYQSLGKKPEYCYFAILGFEPGVVIQAGENRGLTLNQDFIALQVSRAPIEGEASHYQCQATLKMTAPSAHLTAYSRAVVSWVTDSLERPLQATGGWW